MARLTSLLLGCASILFISTTLIAQSATADERETVKQEIQKWYKDLNMAIQLDDRIAPQRLHAPEFHAVHAHGYVDSLEEHIEFLLAPDPPTRFRIPTFSPPERLDIYGNVAVHQPLLSTTSMGNPGLQTRIFVKANGRWQWERSLSTEMQPERKPVHVSPDILNKYVGRYEVEGRRNVDVVAREGDTLVRSVPGFAPKVRLTPVSETQFVDKAGFVLTFEVGASELATHVIVRFRDREIRRATRVDR